MMAYRLRDGGSRSSETVVSAVPALEPGYVFAGKYRIESKLGEGGMGAVYAARHLDLGGRVALKVMLARVASTEATSRFNREARAASMLRGEHVVRTLDAGKLTNGTPYIVLEYVDGLDLEALLAKRRVLPVEEAVALIVQACEGVAEAHARGMVHRDLTLRNMLLTKRVDGTPLLKILDFGVVKISPSGLANTGTNPSITLTRADAMIGSTHYMAPEQIHMSSRVDARADVWSLGVCLYRLLTGAWPFDGVTLAAVLMSIVGQDPKPVDDLRPEVPPELARAIGLALEKSIGGRFRNVAELAGAIAPLVGDYAAEKRINAILSPLDSETIRIERPAPISRPSRSLGSTVHGVAPGPPPPCPTEERRPISVIIAAVVATLVVAAFIAATAYQALR